MRISVLLLYYTLHLIFLYRLFNADHVTQYRRIRGVCVCVGYYTGISGRNFI